MKCQVTDINLNKAKNDGHEPRINLRIYKLSEETSLVIDYIIVCVNAAPGEHEAAELFTNWENLKF